MKVPAGVPQGSILEPLLFLIYISDLHENLELLTKLFADDTSFFSTVYDLSESANLLNEDLKNKSEWAFKWKMLFKPDITEQPQAILSHKNTKSDHPTVFLNEAPVTHTTCQKHLGMYLDEKLNFNTHIRVFQTPLRGLGDSPSGGLLGGNLLDGGNLRMSNFDHSNFFQS